MASITTLAKSNKNQYGDLQVDFQKTIKTAYKNIEFDATTPGCHGGNPDCTVSERNGKWVLDVPDGEYKSSKHYHSSGHSILAIETGRKKLNLAGRPLFLISGRAYNGDYHSLTKTYFLFGQNEDDSFFCHKIRANAAEDGDLDKVRAWVWALKNGETVEARQGDLAFIPKKRASGKVAETVSGFWHDATKKNEAVANLPAGQKLLCQGNHFVYGDEVKRTANKSYVLNPVASHGEHHAVQLEGWHEVRLGKAWGASSAD